MFSSSIVNSYQQGICLSYSLIFKTHTSIHCSLSTFGYSIRSAIPCDVVQWLTVEAFPGLSFPGKSGPPRHPPCRTYWLLLMSMCICCRFYNFLAVFPCFNLNLHDSVSHIFTSVHFSSACLGVVPDKFPMELVDYFCFSHASLL